MWLAIHRMVIRGVAIFAVLTCGGALWAQDLNGLMREFNSHCAGGRYAEAEQVAQRALRIAEQQRNEMSTAVWSSQLGFALSNLGRHAEAESLYQKSLRIAERRLGPNDTGVATVLNNLAELYVAQAEFAKAEPLHQRALQIREKARGRDHPDVAASLNNLAGLYREQGEYAAAEPLFQRSLRIFETAFGPDHQNVATSLNNLASLYQDVGRYSEAEPLYQRSLRIREKVLGPDHPEVAGSLNNLALLYNNQGKYTLAEPLYERALDIVERILGPDHHHVATSLNNLALLYANQGNYTDAEPLYKRSLRISEKALGPRHHDLAYTITNLADVYAKLARYDEAELLYQRSVRILEESLGPDHPHVAVNINNLARLHDDRGHFAEAEPRYQRALGIWEHALGSVHPLVATSQHNLAYLNYRHGDYDAATELVDRAIRIQDQAGEAPGTRFDSYVLRARLSMELGHQRNAIDDLDYALGLADQQRGQFAGAERERAEGFAGFGVAHELMVQWQSELGNTADAFAAAERGRARSFIDQMAAAHVDLLAGLPPAEARRLQQAETDAQAQVASLEEQLAVLATRKNYTPEQTERERERLAASLGQARKDMLDAYAAIRNASPAYRQAVARDFRPAPLEMIQERLAGEDGLILEYLLGAGDGYLFVIPPKAPRILDGTERLDEPTPRVVRLAVTKEQAQVLGIDAGPLTTWRLQAALITADDSGVLQQLRRPAESEELIRRLAVLWQVLIPEPERQALTAGGFNRLIIIPDGPLALLPFETLVVEPAEDPKYLLDAGPPILYGPSATVLYNLTLRSPAAAGPDREPVVTVGNPLYRADAAQVASRGSDILDELTPRFRYGAVGGELTQLPYSGWETSWLQTVFTRQGMGVVQLTKTDATESGVRQAVSGRRVVHLACHGLVDQAYGNFFGALALTPGDRSDPRDDGFLTLPEIYELDLAGCELAILSACQTNFGPRQKGEGTWALSRGFLVAGARRVVASNWLVDDEAAASMVSIFCTRLAREQSEGHTPEHAQALHAAKRWAREQEKWSSPYYWGTFVLVGPQ